MSCGDPAMVAFKIPPLRGGEWFLTSPYFRCLVKKDVSLSKGIRFTRSYRST